MTRLLALLALASAAMTVATVAWITRRCARPCQSAPARALYREPDDGVPAMIPARDTWSVPLTWDGVVKWEREAWPHPLAHD